MQPLVFPGDFRCRASACCGQTCVSSSLFGTVFASPVGYEALLFLVTLDVTTLCLLVHYILFSGQEYLVSFSVVSEDCPGTRVYPWCPDPR